MVSALDIGLREVKKMTDTNSNVQTADANKPAEAPVKVEAASTATTEEAKVEEKKV